MPPERTVQGVDDSGKISFNGHERFVVSSSIRSSRAGSETVLVNLELTSYFSLNETGTIIWESILAGKSLQETHDDLVQRFDGDSVEIWKDIESLARQLLDKRFMSVVRESGDHLAPGA